MHVADPATAAEGRFLALAIGGGLAAVAALDRHGRITLAAAMLAVSAAWLLPYGATRGAAVSALAGGALVIAAGSSWRTSGGPGVRWWLAAAIGSQLLLRGELLLPLAAGSLDPRALISLLAVPTVGAMGATLLSRRHPPSSVLLAAIAGLALAQGWTLMLALALAALAAAEELARRRPLPALALLVVAAAALASGWEMREAVGIALLFAAAFAHGRRTGRSPSIESSAPSLGDARRRVGTAFLLAVVSLGALGLAGAFPASAARGWGGAVVALATLPLLLPRMPLVHPVTFLFAALVGLAALLWVPGSAALVPILLAGALTLPREGVGASAQRVWSAALAALVGLAGAYPWMRDPALDAALERLGLEVGWLAAGVVVLALVALAGLEGFSRRRADGRAPAAAASGSLKLTALAIAAAVIAALPAAGPDLLPAGGKVLDARHPNWGVDLEPRTASALVVGSSLANGAELAAGTRVARLRCFHLDGSISEWRLEVGEATGEWAARRHDLDAAAPAPFVATVAPGGELLAQRYRGVWTIVPERPVRRVSVLRDPSLPPEVELRLWRVGLRR